MVDQTVFTSLQKPLSTARTIFVCLPENPRIDQVAAGLGLYLALKKAGKEVSIFCPTQMRVEFSDLVGIDQIGTKLKGRNLVVSFDYLEDSIEKVSYNIENNKFNLVIQPKTGFPPLSQDKVAYSYSGGSVDLIFSFGLRDLKRLGEIFEKSRTIFEQEKIVDIDLTPKSSRFAQTELILNVAAFSEITTRMIMNLGLPMDGDIGRNLLLGLEKGSQRFSSPRVTAATFEAAAFCLKAGAKRDFVSPMVEKSPLPPKKAPLRPMPADVSAAKRPEEPEIEEEEKPQPDWLQPKIYKGNTRI